MQLSIMRCKIIMSKISNRVMFAKPTSTTSVPTNAGENVSKPVKPVIKLPRYLVPIGMMAFTIAMFFFPFTTSASKLGALYLWGNDGKVSGRTGGNVQMRNGRSRGMAFFATVINSFTSAAKAVFAFFNSNWNNLTEDERIGWMGYKTFTSDRFARKVPVTGKTAYVRLNVNISNVGGTALLLPPSKTAPSPTALTTLTATASTGVVKLTYILNADGVTTQVYATKPLSAGVFKPSASAFRLFAIADTSAASPVLLTTDYSDRFGAITGAVGKKIFIRTVTVDAATGLTSIAEAISTIIVA